MSKNRIERQISDFPTGNFKLHIEVPPADKIQNGDILIARYSSSRWARFLPWENWHHAAIVSEVKPLKIIEAAGPNTTKQSSGPAEIAFDESVGFGLAKDILEIIWLKPKFPDPIREYISWIIPRRARKIISESHARTRVIEYARKHLGEEYSHTASKWSESSWYCSLLIYKSFSKTITDMYLENYDDLRAGFFVTPEDILKSNRVEKYFSWKYSGIV